MSRKKYSKDFKNQVVKEVIETDHNTALVARRNNLSQRTVYNWYAKEKNKEVFGQIDSVKKFRKKFEEVQLENQILKELLKKTYQVWSKE